MSGLVQETLYLACTRPELRRGVPALGYWGNIIGCLLIGALVNKPGLTEPLFLVAVPIHYAMRWQTDRNPNWAAEWQAWWRTLGTSTSRVLWALPARRGKQAASHV